MDYFTCGKRNNHHANFGNTVLVNRGDQVWMLAYVQDVDGDNLYVDYDCSALVPGWIQSEYVWQHVYDDKPWTPHNVYVAVRSSAEGPYIFRPASVLEIQEPLLYATMCAMVSFSATEGNPEAKHVVHQWQIVEQLPTEQPSLGGRVRELPFLKLTIRSDHIHRIHKLKEHEILRFMQLVISAARYECNSLRAQKDRFFVKLENDRLEWLLMEVHGWDTLANRASRNFVFMASAKRRLLCAAENLIEFYTNPKREQEARWTAYILASAQNGYGLPDSLALQRVANEWFAPCKCQYLFPVRSRDRCLYRYVCDHTVPSSAGRFAHSDSIVFVPGTFAVTVLPEVLLQLDSCSRARMKRVCHLWNEVLKTVSFAAFVVIDFLTIRQYPLVCAETLGYVIGCVADRSVNRSTQTLALLHLGRRGNVYGALSTVATVLSQRKIRLAIVVIKSCVVTLELDCVRRPMKHFLHNLSFLMPYCRRLLLRDYSIMNVFCDCSERYRPYEFGSRPGKPRLPVTFFKEAFDCSAFSESQEDVMFIGVHHYMAALENSLPLVDLVRERVRRMWEVMTKKAEYPLEWRRFRNFLTCHSFGDGVISNEYWQTADLRDFDALHLSRFMLHLLGASTELPFKFQPHEEWFVPNDP
ncbi:uncharacterized protein LOC129591447 [Paramacrobiotus metropolitanus]|uniref:uncharacterized protein LOC129591447 n=1 Tax=Paramacrobiotus metropolitanus TaxID=2943436 RepID=UPI002445CF31|nr:uncharacterized protein LOC129591447 [Paramacrobiotus metropolitanus]